MRNKEQIKKRQERCRLANIILEWMKSKDITCGRNAGETVISPLSWDITMGEKYRKEKWYAFDVWKAWEMLRESYRIVGDERVQWRVSSWTPLLLDHKGDII